MLTSKYVMVIFSCWKFVGHLKRYFDCFVLYQAKLLYGCCIQCVFNVRVNMICSHWSAITLLRPGRAADYCDERVCLWVRPSVCTDISETTHSNFIKFSVHVACARCSVLLWWCCNTLICYYLFLDDIVFIHWALWWRDAAAAASLQCRVQPEHPFCVLLVASCHRRRRALRLDECGAECATHHCLVCIVLS